MKRIQLVYANYGCSEEICRSIFSIGHQDDSLQIDIFVVENNGKELNEESVKLPNGCNLRVLLPKKNVGYFGALMEAIDATKDQASYDFRILTNPDIEFIDSSLFKNMVDLNLDKSVAILAPAIISGISGADQNPYLVSRPSSTQLRRWKFVYSSWFIYAAYQLLSDLRLRLLSFMPKQSHLLARQLKIYAPHGAFIVFVNQFLEKTKDIERMPFLFSEELFLGEICYRSARTVLYRPDLIVRHIEHATTGRIRTRLKFRMNKQAVCKFMNFFESIKKSSSVQ